MSGVPSRSRRTGPIRVVIADDHGIVRMGLVSLLRAEAQAGIEVVAEASDGEEAYTRIVETDPDVAVVDAAMPRMTGIELARKLRDEGSPTAVLVLSMHREPAFVRTSIEAGASGYLVKESDVSELVIAIRAAANGEVYVSPVLASALAAGMRMSDDVELSARERDVLRLVAQGLSNREIAARLFISVRTVEGHRAAIMDKLGIHNVPGLVRYAIRQQLVTLDE